MARRRRVTSRRKSLAAASLGAALMASSLIACLLATAGEAERADACCRVRRASGASEPTRSCSDAQTLCNTAKKAVQAAIATLINSVDILEKIESSQKTLFGADTHSRRAVEAGALGKGRQ